MEPIQTQHYFKDIAQEFLVYCQFGKETPVAKTTLVGYGRGVKLINKIFGDKPIENLDANDVLLLRKSILERGCAISYLHKILSMLRSILRYCREERDMELFPLEKIKLPKIKWRDVEFYSVSQVEKIISIIETQTIHGIRLMAVVAGFLDSGMRISELLSLDRTSIDYGDGSAYITGKGGKMRKVFFRQWSMDWIRKYLAQRTDSDPALFVVHHPGYELARLRPEDVRKMMRRISKTLGFKVRPHALRRTFATLLHGNGVDIRFLQALLGHSSVQVTERYVGVDQVMLKAMVNTKMNYGLAEAVTSQMASIRWAKGHDQCIECGQTRRPHLARGYCDSCYMNARNHKELNTHRVLALQAAA